MRISGNLTQIKWVTTAGGSTAVGTTGAIDVAEGSAWSFEADYEDEDTTVCGSDSPRADMNIRRMSPISVEIISNNGTLPAGLQRLPAKSSVTGAHPDPMYLRLILDKYNPTVDYYECNAFLKNVRVAARARGGQKVRYLLTFIPTGAITQVSTSTTTTIL